MADVHKVTETTATCDCEVLGLTPGQIAIK